MIHNVTKKLSPLKVKLRGINPPLVDVLPRGAINELAEKCGFARQNIVMMLKGKVGKEENVKLVCVEALRLIMEEVQNKEKVIKVVQEIQEIQEILEL